MTPRALAAGNGRALFIDASGSLYVGRGGVVWRSDDDGASWVSDCSLAASSRFDPRGWSRLSRRLFRRHFQAMEVLPDGTRVVIARDGIYRSPKGSPELARVFAIRRGSRPLDLSCDDEGRVVFGEYGRNPERREVHLYASTDGAKSFDICHTFPSGTIRHVHGVLFDVRVAGFWVFTGDVGSEAGLGLLASDLTTFRWIRRGEQVCRAVQAILAGDSLVYGTDSELEPNAIVRLDVRTGRIERLRPIDGSSLFAGCFGGLGLISTCVEPSRVNRAREAVLYGSEDLSEWVELDRESKDPWPSFFQFGTFVLAKSRSPRRIALLSGQAIRGRDERCQVMELC